MKSGKFIFIAMIFLVSLLCLSAVSAADDAASDVIADNTDETVLEESIDDADLQLSENDEIEQSNEKLFFNSFIFPLQNLLNSLGAE